jgi:hypothetical protein
MNAAFINCQQLDDPDLAIIGKDRNELPSHRAEM